MLDDYPRQQLQQLIRQFGHKVLDNPKRCTAILRDLCPAHRREVNLLVAALQERAVMDLLQLRADQPKEPHIRRLAMRLHDHLGTAEPFALWAVESWVLVLGLSQQSLRHPNQAESEANGLPPSPATPSKTLLGASSTSPYIHGWPTDKVQDLQRTTAAALGLPVMFHSQMKSGEWGPDMVVIPAGSFLMGSPNGEPGRDRDEGPQHQVTFAKPFAIGRYAVTFDEYDRFCAATLRDKPSDGGWGRGNRPAINVSWHDAQAYCDWLGAQDGQRYRLPSEAEWEYACRAGTATPFWWGHAITSGQANYDDKSRNTTMPVNNFLPNPWGLYQVHGNVWEWCEDLWHLGYDGAPEDGGVWASGHNTFLRAIRGGSWICGPLKVRAAVRNFEDPNRRSSHLGFRLAQDIAL